MSEVFLIPESAPLHRHRLGALTSLGRHPENSIEIPDRSVSKFHAQIQRTDMGDYSVEKFMVLTGRKIELVTGIRAEEGEAIRRQGTSPMPPTAEG